MPTKADHEVTIERQYFSFSVFGDNLNKNHEKNPKIFELWTKNIPTRILNYIITIDNIIKLIIVSPWITPQRDERLLRILCRKIRNERINTIIITRIPRYSWHQKAIQMLNRAGARIYFNDDLHAKIILVKTVDMDYGFFGTANLTYNANFTDDIVVFIKGVEEGKEILERLTLYVYHLK